MAAVHAFGCAAFSIAALAAENPLRLPQPGAHELRIISPEWLELARVTTKQPDPTRVQEWDFVSGEEAQRLPRPDQFLVRVDETTNRVIKVGFRRRVLYAPLKERDLRIGNSLFLQLESPVHDGQSVVVQSMGTRLWPDSDTFTATADPLRWSPAIHVNEVGYLPEAPKIAMVGYYLGSAGELDLEIPARTTRSALEEAEAVGATFKLIETRSGKEVFRGRLTPRPDRGFPFTTYGRVLQAEFTKFHTPGEYRLVVPGLGGSFPFAIGEGVAGIWARTYALGIYHQRCGMANLLPFTRFTHDACHLAPAEVPTMSARFESVNSVLQQETEDASKDERYTARPLRDVDASLYPFINKSPVTTRGGHHDAGDYSKYTENSATFIHLLVFAADNFPGVADLDNLGLPESGDGKSDVLQEAKWEADFLARMQDEDGGFYFLVYPRDRRYEDNVTPDKGDPQVVFPKTLSVSAAATAALAQCASSPRFKAQFPEEAAVYLAKARKGWAFVQRAVAQYGKEGAYQKITHYGNDFGPDDELAWAACEMFLATHDPAIHRQLMGWLDPADPATRKWSWWRLFEAYGHAIRSYAFAVRSGRVNGTELSRPLLNACEEQIIAAGEDQLRRAQDCAYGTSFPIETKRTRTAGWYFASDAMFDLATALQLDYPVRNDPREKMKEALIGNINFELGCNPVNVSYLTGTGWKRQREIVHQYAQNDDRVLPPSGIPLGCIQDGFGWLDKYGKELGELTYPADDDSLAPYPFYDRWGDSFNLKTEFVISNQARGLAALAWLMAQTTLKTQVWQSAEARITGIAPAARQGATLITGLAASGLDLEGAQIVWESDGREPFLGKRFQFTPADAGEHWIEAEALLPDGRRVFARTNVVVR